MEGLQSILKQVIFECHLENLTNSQIDGTEMNLYGFRPQLYKLLYGFQTFELKIY